MNCCGMNFWRSEPMEQVEIVLDSATAFDTVNDLGEAGLVQFIDMNGDELAHNRKYASQIKTIFYLEGLLANLSKHLKNNKIKIPECDTNVVPFTTKELKEGNMFLSKKQENLLSVAKKVDRVNKSVEMLKARLEEKQDIKSVYELALKFMSEGSAQSVHFQDVNKQAGDGVVIEAIGGIMPTNRAYTFETILVRSYGMNIHVYTSPHIAEKDQGESKTEYIVFCHGTNILSKIEKLGKSFRATTFRLPNQKPKCERIIRQLEMDIEDLKEALALATDMLNHELHQAAKQHDCWRKQLKKTKAIYNVLNGMDDSSFRNVTKARGWVAKKNVPKLAETVNTSAWKGNSHPTIRILEPEGTVPTYFEQNKFTRAFQNIIDAYGVPSYQEINPAPFAIITFPFLFGVMFGDIGHGTIMFIAALAVVIYEKRLEAMKIKNEIWTLLFGGRYIILLMGAFSIYAGILYTDCFGNAFSFGSRWRINYDKSTVNANPLLELDPTKDFLGTPYPIGLDPIWVLAKNKIDFQNSFKMKTAIIFGVLHMELGLILSFFNDLYFKTPLNIFTEFIPRLIFFTSLFGYLIFLVFYKWVFYGPGRGDDHSSACAPSVLITFINMILFKGFDKKPNCVDEFYPGQSIVQPILLGLAFLCVPWMLIAKPTVLLMRRHKRIEEKRALGKVQSKEENRDKKKDKSGQDTEESVMDIIVSSCIHTIEFVLGCISYTASYLRLWALSLAHAQLSEVLWNMVLIKAYMLSGDVSFSILSVLSWVMVYVIFIVWSALTIGILVLMEGLSAFLHALRLHWMEFQSKFFAGTGIIFAAFSFNELLKDDEITD